MCTEGVFEMFPKLLSAKHHFQPPKHSKDRTDWFFSLLKRAFNTLRNSVRGVTSDF